MDIQETHAAVVEKLGINVENLRSHRNFLNDNKSNIQRHFKMHQFYRNVNEYPEDEVEYVRKAGLDIDCGSAMCVVGWAPANPEIAEQLDPDRGPDKWNGVTNLFIDNEQDVNLFTYLFGQDWVDDVDLAVERMDYVIEAAETASEDNIRFLCAAANNELNFDFDIEDYPVQDDRCAVVPGVDHYYMEDWVESVLHNRYIIDIV